MSVKKIPADGSSVRVVPGRTATGPGIETRGNKITIESQRTAANKLIEDDRNRIMNDFAKNPTAGQGRGPSVKTIEKNQPVPRAANKKNPIKIDSNPKTSQGTQAGHTVTDNNNHTTPVVSSGPSMETRMGAVGGRGGGLLEQMR